MYEGKITQDEYQRQEQEIRLVANYCLNDIDCRRQQVLRFFAQPFDPADCNNTCDNCWSGSTGTRRDLTDEARQVVKIVKELENRNLTQPQCVDLFVGYSSKAMRDKGYERVAGFKAGQHLDKTVVDRMLSKLSVEGILGSNMVANAQGFNTSYLKVSCFWENKSL